MKKYLFIFLFISSSVFGQHFGFNGAGFFENYDAQTIKWLHDWNQPFTIRIPGGAISKFHDPYNNRKGWGMTEANVKNWFNTSGFDEDGQGLDKWLRKTEEQPDHSFMDDLINLQKEFPNMQVIYVLNILNSTPEANMTALRYMIKGGVKIVGVEAGNEVYGKYNSFDEYVKDFEPVFKIVKKEFPQIKTAICVAPIKGIKEKDFWNQQMSKYKGDYDAAIVHFYYTGKEMKDVYSSMPENVVADENKINNSLDKVYRLAINTLMENKLFTYHIEESKRLFPGKAIWITEWNTKPSDVFNNTILNGAWQMKSLIDYRNDVEYLCIHNGVGPDKYGMISRTNKFDSEKTALVRRMGYWAYQLAGEAGNAIELKKDKTYIVSFSDEENVCYYFYNFGETYKTNIQYAENNTIATIHYVSGKYIYSSSGTAGYMGKGTKASYEVNGIIAEKFSSTIPKNSFGYIEFQKK
ncbi:MAG: hypothetical protein H7Y00_02335 [Fimbriimonadaceae bacterium]|nr:hypothetical protein [Chitinophagales bacterium]